MSHALITLDSWVNDLPPSVITKRPGILSIRGTIAYIKGNAKEGLEFLDRAEKSFRKTGETESLALTLVRRTIVYRFLGDYTTARHDADEALQLTESSDKMQSIHANALRQKGLCLLRQGNSRQAVKILERALEFYKRQEDSAHIPILMMETGVAYEKIGKIGEAKRLYDDALVIWKKEGNLSWQANLLNNMGVVHFLQGEYDKAILVLEEGLLCAKQSGYSPRLEALLLTSLGDVHAEVEDFDLAKQHYVKGSGIAAEIGDRFLLNYLSLAQAKLSLQQLDIDEAERLLDKASHVISSQTSQYEDGLYQMLRGQLLLTQKKMEPAREALEIAESRFRVDEHTIEFVKSQILLAAAYLQGKNQTEAKEKIKAVLESDNYTEHPILVFIRHAEGWLDDLQNNDDVGRLLRDIFHKSHQIHKKMPGIRRQLHRLIRTTEVPDAGLTIQALGRARVKVGGKILTMSDWQTQSVRDLFFYFMMMKEPQTREQIGEVLWSDLEEPSRLKMRFKNDMYRLRRAAGSEAIIYRNNLYSFNRTADYEYDVEAFESLLFQAKITNDSGLQIELLQRAVDLVNGQFLEDVYATWVWPAREHINRVFLQSLLDLAELLKNENKTQEALAAYKRAIEHDPTFEAAYLHAMNLYRRLNDRVSAIRLYEDYTRMMDHELDLPPSPEIVAVYKRIAR